MVQWKRALGARLDVEYLIGLVDRLVAALEAERKHVKRLCCIVDGEMKCTCGLKELLKEAGR